ncbi:MAG: hypothetical protein K8S23_01150 [Candidatus Cloacimonetes bacterium]|nr:hypothetical protein [Candidatus Cloacimonadota bacterium]
MEKYYHLLKKDRLIELLSNEKSIVREESVSALTKFFPNQENVLSHLLELINRIKIKYKESESNRDFLSASKRMEGLSLLASIKNFIPSDSEFKEIIKLYLEFENIENNFASNLQYHIILSFIKYPLKILEKNQNIFIFNKHLNKVFEMTKQRDKFIDKTPDTLWEILNDFCINHYDEYKEKGLDRIAKENFDLVVIGLSKHKEISSKVLLELNRTKNINYLLEEALVTLAGNLKIVESIPFLFDILKKTNSMQIIYSISVHSLKKIGGIEVVNELEKLYDTDLDMKMEFASILGYIPYNYSENLLIKLLKKEKDITNKTVLATSLCRIFSKKGLEYVLDMVNNLDYDPTMNDLHNHIISVFEYHNIELPNEKKMIHSGEDFSRKSFEKSPLHKMGKELRENLKSIESSKQIEEKKKVNYSNNVIVLSQKALKNKKKKIRKMKRKSRKRKK